MPQQVADSVAQQVIGVPAPPLRGFVSAYVGYCYQGFEPGTHQGLPSRSLTFIVSFDDPVDLVGLPDRTQPPARLWALAGGLHASAATIRHDGNQHGVQLTVTPAGARALFRRPAAELASTVVALDDVLGRAGVELVDRLSSTPSWPARFAVLDDVLTRVLTEPASPSREVTFAWDRLVATGGAVPVAAVAREAGWSRRHLSERFRREFGLGPKTMARVLRFERSRARLGASDGVSLARLAAECGYADQAHLTREWKDLAGATPTTWLAEERLPILQDADPLDRAG